MESHLALAAEQPADRIVAAAREAEALGIDGLWITDVRFTRDCFVLLGAVAAVTDRIVLGVGVNDPFSRHPAALAAAYATLAELAPGRVIVGLGAGGSGLDRIGVQRTKPVATVRAAIGAIRDLLAGREASAESPGFRLVDGRLTFMPDGPMPIALVAHGPVMYALAGELADTVIIANYATPEAIGVARESIAAGIRKRPPELGPPRECWRVDVCVADDAEAARRVMRARVRQLLGSGYYSAPFLEPLGLAHLAGADPSQEDLEAVVDAVAFAGTPDDVTSRLSRVVAGQPFAMVNWRAYAADGQSLTDAVRACNTVIRSALS